MELTRGQYLYCIDVSIGSVTCEFALTFDEIDILRANGFKELNEFSLEEKVNVAFVGVAALYEELAQLRKIK